VALGEDTLNNSSLKLGLDGLSVVYGCVSWINSNIKRNYWENERVRKVFARRSANLIKDDGDVFFMNPCLDYVLLAKDFLGSRSMDSGIVAQEVFSKKYDIYHMHFALEFLVKGRKYFVDFAKMNTVYLGKGDFVNFNEDVRVVQTFRIWEPVDPDKDIFENFPEYVAKLKHYSIDVQIDRMLKDNSKERFDSFLQSLGKNKSLRLVRVPDDL